MNEFWSAVIVAVLALLGTVFGPLLLEKIKHRHKKEDAQEADTIAAVRRDIRDYQDETFEQFSELKKTTEERMDKFDGALSQVAQTTDALVQNEVARTYINIRREAHAAIKAGSISARDKEKLMAEYERYKRLPNANGFLFETMKTVMGLRVIVEDGDLE